MSDAPRPTPRSTRAAARRRNLSALLWCSLGLVPVLYLVELGAPMWLNHLLRGIWVVLAVSTVTYGCWMLWAGRAATGARGSDR
ncbi:MAG: hypothetical protein ACK4V6_17440 [Microthrixaceae bacterium]